VRYTADQTAVATFTVAIDRPVSAGKEKQTDFPRVTVFGKQAENCERYIFKGSLVGVQGSIKTGSYKNKDGATVYTTDIIANRVEFLGSKSDGKSRGGTANTGGGAEGPPEGGYAAMDDDDGIPF
jgi:single-strand DNA-binding protein